MSHNNTPVEVQLFRLSPGACDLLARKKAPREFLTAALEQKLFVDAVSFVTQWLPPRCLVWWGCLCAWQVLRTDRSQAAEEALRAAVQWVAEPSEANRRRAEAAGYAADFTTPAGNIAFGAFHSGDNIAPAGGPPVRPAAGLAGNTIANALTLLLARVPEPQKDALRERFVRLALAHAEGQLPWPAPVGSERRPACPV